MKRTLIALTLVALVNGAHASIIKSVPVINRFDSAANQTRFASDVRNSNLATPVQQQQLYTDYVERAKQQQVQQRFAEVPTKNTGVNLNKVRF